jgi:hypothetical protein
VLLITTKSSSSASNNNNKQTLVVVLPPKMVCSSDAIYDLNTDINGVESDNNRLGQEMFDVDVISVALDVFTIAIIDVESPYYDMAHYINDNLIIYDRFNEIITLFFEME